MEFKVGDIVKILSPEGTIIFEVLPYSHQGINIGSRINIIRIFPPVETRAETVWPLDWQIIKVWRRANESN